MKRPFLLCLQFAVAFLSHAQSTPYYIVTGTNQGPDVAIENFSPFVALSVDPPNGYTTARYWLDADQDGDDELEITLDWELFPGGHRRIVWVESYSGTKVKQDSFHFVAMVPAGDTIDHTTDWSNQFTFAKACYYFEDFVYPGITEYPGWIGEGRNFMVFSHIDDGQTLYGWLEMSIPNWASVHIYGAASNSLDPPVNAVAPAITRLETFPNPVKEELTVEVDDGTGASLRFEVWNMEGKRVMEGTLRNKGLPNKLETASWPPGLYAIQIKTRTGIKTEKVLKVR